MKNLITTILGTRLVICCAPLLVPCGAAADAQRDDAALAHARRVLARAPVIDGHNDLPWHIREDSIARGDPSRYDLRSRARGSTDLERLRQGMIGGQFWSV